MTKHRDQRMRDHLGVPLSAELNAALNMARQKTGLTRAEITRRALVLFFETHYGKTVLENGNARNEAAQS